VWNKKLESLQYLSLLSQFVLSRFIHCHWFAFNLVRHLHTLLMNL
jgi:hypothetical protein